MKLDLMTKENIGSMIIMVVSGVIFMPIIGLSSFHIFLVSTGRTTNEQVTGKYRSGYNPFNKGMFRNVAVVCCGAQYPRFIDHVGRQQIPYLDSFHAALESDPAVPAGNSRSVLNIESHQVHVYTPEDERGPGGIKKLGPDGVLEYKPLKKQPLDLLKPTLDADDRGSNAGDISRDSSMVTIRRFPKLGGGVGEDDSVLGFETQGSKCNLLDENESAFEAPLVNFRRNPAVAAAAVASGDVELGIMESGEHRQGNERYSSPGNDKYQQMLKEAYGHAPNSKQSTPVGDGLLKNGPTNETNRTRPIAGGGQKFAYVPASALQQSSIVNKSQSMDALKMNNVPSETSPKHGEQMVHSSIPPRLATADANYKRPLSFTQAVQLHDSLTQAKADPKSGGKRGAGTGNNVNEIRV